MRTASPGWSRFWKIKLPLILPVIGIVSVLTFVGNFNSFHLVYTTQVHGRAKFLDRPSGSLLYRTFFGAQLQLGDPAMGSTIAAVMFLIILSGVCVYLFGIQTRLRRYVSSSKATNSTFR